MTDNKRRTLEMAAKAAGLVNPKPAMGCGIVHGGGRYWNPLTDDGDALRLFVALRMCLQHDDAAAAIVGWSRNQRVALTRDGFGPWYVKEWAHDNGGDHCATLRKAITRAAAAIGESMP